MGAGPVAVIPRRGSGLGFVSPLVSHSVPLEGESFAFPLPTFASLSASPSRTSSCDQEGLPPWNPRCFAAQISRLASVEKPCPLRPQRTSSDHARDACLFRAPSNWLEGVGEVNITKNSSEERLWGPSPLPPRGPLTAPSAPSASMRLSRNWRWLSLGLNV
jgi:hypothetical protein